MRSGLVLALDRTGRLRTARWSDVSRSGRQISAKPLAATTVPLPKKASEILNDFGQEEIRVSARTVACSSESSPEDRPHASLRSGG